MAQGGISRVARARAEAGLTQAQLAEAVGVSTKTVGRIERGEHRPRLPLAVRLSRVLGLTVEELVGVERAA